MFAVSICFIILWYCKELPLLNILATLTHLKCMGRIETWSGQDIKDNSCHPFLRPNIVILYPNIVISGIAKSYISIHNENPTFTHTLTCNSTKNLWISLKLGLDIVWAHQEILEGMFTLFKAISLVSFKPRVNVCWFTMFVWYSKKLPLLIILAPLTRPKMYGLPKNLVLMESRR